MTFGFLDTVANQVIVLAWHSSCYFGVPGEPFLLHDLTQMRILVAESAP